MLYPNLQISVNKEYDLRPTGMFGRRWKDYMKSKYPQRLSELIALGQINELMLKNAYLGKLNGENRAISVSIKSLAAGLSGKLEAGDIVTLIASDVGEKRKTLVLPELQYVEIIATTASSGTDNDVQADVEDGEEQELASTITVLATPEQARLLAELEQTGKLHAALVFRGDSTQAQKFLDEQQKVLEELYTEELEGEAETAEADAEEEKEEPIVDDVEVNAGGQ